MPTVVAITRHSMRQRYHSGLQQGRYPILTDGFRVPLHGRVIDQGLKGDLPPVPPRCISMAALNSRTSECVPLNSGRHQHDRLIHGGSNGHNYDACWFQPEVYRYSQSGIMHHQFMEKMW